MMTNRLASWASWPEFYFHCKSCAGRGMEGEITEEAIYDAAEQIAAIARDVIQSQRDRLS